MEAFILEECDFVVANAPALEPNILFAALQLKARVLMRGRDYSGALATLSIIINSGNFFLATEWGADAITSDVRAYLSGMMMKDNGVYPARYAETLLSFGTLNQQSLDRLNQLIEMRAGNP